ncbi:LysR family transcriptional regulator [Micromonospora sp. NPDC047074]|uniref:LysR family transcriptional regulator n=1 Tax=Micromonospora sp. NPDC047074 TaxID=3154339 RepID=UPI00340FBB1B
MELRDIEIFLTLSAELHFGRTAERLRISQARVSQAIKQQERSIGGRLFERTSRAVRLTPLGDQLRDDLTPHYQGVKESLARARLSARGVTAVLRIGTIAAFIHDLDPVWSDFRRRHPQWGLNIRYTQYLDAFAALRRNDMDALICWLPVEEVDFTVGPLVHTGQRVLAVAHDHPLTRRSTVSLERLAEDHGVVTGQPHIPDYWEDACVPFHTPKGRAIERRVHVATLEDILMLVGTGQVTHLMRADAPRYHSRPDLTFVPFEDAPDMRWALVWRSDSDDNPRVRALAGIFREHGPLRH